MANADWNDELDILSAENVSFSIETAGLGSRFGAVLIDMTIQGFVVMLLLLGATWVSGYVLPFIKEWSAWGRAIGAALLVLVGVTITHGYYFLFEWLWDGQTPGKRWLGLRVVRTSGMPISAWEALTRNLLRTVDFLPPPYGIGALVALINPLNRRIGDMVAGTVVARERHDVKNTVLDIDTAVDAFLATQAGRPAATPAAAAFEYSKGTATSSAATAMQADVVPSARVDGITGSGAHDPEQAAALARLQPADIELLHEFMTRRAGLGKDPRQRLALSLARRLSARLEQPPPSPDRVEEFLDQLARALHHDT